MAPNGLSHALNRVNQRAAKKRPAALWKPLRNSERPAASETLSSRNFSIRVAPGNFGCGRARKTNLSLEAERRTR